MYSAAMKPERQASGSPPQRIIVETDMPDYYLSIAQQRAAAYYQEKYRLSKESKIAQHFTSDARKSEPETTADPALLRAVKQEFAAESRRE